MDSEHYHKFGAAGRRDNVIFQAPPPAASAAPSEDVGSVESNPALRDVRGIPHGLRLDDILPASGKLDNEFDPPSARRHVDADAAARIGRRDCGGSRQARRRSWVAA
jgi:hypothetical protein